MLHNVTVPINTSEQSDSGLRWNDCREEVENESTCSSGYPASVTSATLVLLLCPGQKTSAICLSVMRTVIRSFRPKNIKYYITVKEVQLLLLVDVYIVSGSILSVFKN